MFSDPDREPQAAGSRAALPCSVDTPKSPTIPETPTVPDSLSCVGCGYDLVGLPEDVNCPECGVAIGRSISGDHLFASSREHRDRLANGARLALIGAWAGWASASLLAVYALVAQTVNPYASLLVLGPMAIAMAVTLVASGQGWLRLTDADPDRIGDGSERWIHRLLLRLYAGALGTLGPVLVIVWCAFDAIARVAGSVPGPPASVLLSAVLFVPTLALSGPIATEVIRLARRLLEGDLAERSRGLAPSGWMACGLVILAAQFVWFHPGGWWWLLEPIAWTITSIALLAWGVQYHTLVRALRIALAAVAVRP